jgi:hypothetical protein
MYIHERISGIQGAPMLDRFVPLPQLDVKKHGASDVAVTAAAAVMDKIFSGLSPLNVDFLRGLSIHLHIIPHGKQVTDIAEFRKQRGQTAFDGTAMRLGSRIVYAVAEESIAEGFVVAQESARVVARFALRKSEQQWLQSLFNERKQKGGAWVSADAAFNPEAYFSGSVAALFGYRFNRAWLYQNDPRMHSLVSAVFRHAPGPIPG